MSHLPLFLQQLEYATDKLSKHWNVSIDKIKIQHNNLGIFGYHNLSKQTIAYGLSDNLPVIDVARIKYGVDKGFAIYVREIGGMQFAVGWFKSEEHGHLAVFTKKGEYFRICRLLHKLKASIKSSNNIKPILEEKLFQDIYNNTIGFLNHTRTFKKYGVKPRRGVIFDGPPGNGKSMMVSYLKRACTNKEHKTITSSIIEHAYKDGNLVEQFRGADFIVFDDVDISYFNRKSGKAEIACDMLSCMDGAEKDRDGCVWLFTTNEDIIDLDPAFLRPGRIDKRFKFELPTKELRQQLIQTWPQDILTNIDSEYLLSESDGFSFAELDAIKTNLVSGYYIDNLGWNLNKSLEVVNEYRDAIKSHKKDFGFATKKLSNEVPFATRKIGYGEKST